VKVTMGLGMSSVANLVMSKLCTSNFGKFFFFLRESAWGIQETTIIHRNVAH
jgi:hypothetical protein